jgi:hypothetical protein
VCLWLWPSTRCVRGWLGVLYFRYKQVCMRVFVGWWLCGLCA